MATVPAMHCSVAQLGRLGRSHMGAMCRSASSIRLTQKHLLVHELLRVMSTVNSSLALLRFQEWVSQRA